MYRHDRHSTKMLLFSLSMPFFKGTLGGLFSQILQGEDIVRERAIKFLSTKLKTMPDDTMTKEVEDYIFTETKKVPGCLFFFREATESSFLVCVVDNANI